MSDPRSANMLNFVFFLLVIIKCIEPTKDYFSFNNSIANDGFIEISINI
jgi:hypothetical protein